MHPVNSITIYRLQCDEHVKAKVAAATCPAPFITVTPNNHPFSKSGSIPGQKDMETSRQVRAVLPSKETQINGNQEKDTIICKMK